MINAVVTSNTTTGAFIDATLSSKSGAVPRCQHARNRPRTKDFCGCDPCVRAHPRPSHLASYLIGVERSTQCLVAPATAAVFPVHLDQPVVRTERLVVPTIADGAVDRPEFPGAFIGILRAR